MLVRRGMVERLVRPLELKEWVEGDLHSAAVRHRRRICRQRTRGRGEHFFQPRSDDLLLCHFPDWNTPSRSRKLRQDKRMCCCSCCCCYVAIAVAIDVVVLLRLLL